MRDPGFGALVLSLDFELHWGVRDRHAAGGAYRENLLGERVAIPRMLELFDAHDVAATWATVGFLFARTRAELEAFSPTRRPTYETAAIDPYAEPLGATEQDDPLHFAASLIERIKATPRQEIGSHTFSHFFCSEEGHDVDSFRADLASAHVAAGARGVDTTTLVFPYNQVVPSHRAVLAECGFEGYRGLQRGILHSVRSTQRRALAIRLGRLVDAYLPLGRSVVRWQEIVPRDGVLEIPASRFLRPYDPVTRAFEPLRRRRILAALDRAARERQVFHLWWHPHNFGTHTEENLEVLGCVLDRFDGLRDRYGMRSLSMAEVVELARVDGPG